MMKNLYVNGLHKSVEDEEYAKDMIRRVQKCSKDEPCRWIQLDEVYQQ